MMVTLFNFLPWLIIVLGGFIWYKTKKWQWFVSSLLLAAVLNTTSLDVVPRGVVQRGEVPAFEIKDIPVQDRLLKHDTNSNTAKVEELKKKQALENKNSIDSLK